LGIVRIEMKVKIVYLDYFFKRLDINAEKDRPQN